MRLQKKSGEDFLKETGAMGAKTTRKKRLYDAHVLVTVEKSGEPYPIQRFMEHHIKSKDGDIFPRRETLAAAHDLFRDCGLQDADISFEITENDSESFLRRCAELGVKDLIPDDVNTIALVVPDGKKYTIVMRADAMPWSMVHELTHVLHNQRLRKHAREDAEQLCHASRQITERLKESFGENKAFLQKVEESLSEAEPEARANFMDAIEWIVNEMCGLSTARFIGVNVRNTKLNGKIDQYRHESVARMAEIVLYSPRKFQELIYSVFGELKDFVISTLFGHPSVEAA